MKYELNKTSDECIGTINRLSSKNNHEDIISIVTKMEGDPITATKSKELLSHAEWVADTLTKEANMPRNTLLDFIKEAVKDEELFMKAVQLGILKTTLCE